MFSRTAKTAETDKEGPRPFWDTILTTTPVVMTVLATILAGLSSGEMTRAQYYRTLAAQYQSKVTDQWGFFQAKRTRATMLRNLAVSSSQARAISADELTQVTRLEQNPDDFSAFRRRKS